MSFVHLLHFDKYVKLGRSILSRTLYMPTPLAAVRCKRGWNCGSL